MALSTMNDDSTSSATRLMLLLLDYGDDN